jgi:hypothetical protein
MTPEARVKHEIRMRLHALHEQHRLYYHQPVMNGMGKPTLDFNPVVLYGWMCAIEAKAPGEDLTPRQMQTFREITDAGGRVFKIDGSDADWKRFENWVSYAILERRFG